MVSRKELENASKLSEKIAALEAIHRISLAISSKLEIGALLQFVVDEVSTLLAVESCSILLPDIETGEMVFRAAIDPIVGMRVPFGEGIVARVFTTGIPQIVNDVSSDADYFSKIEQDSNKPIQSLLAIPLLVEDDVIGVLEAINKENGRFTEEDRDLLMTMAGYAAIAIENARLYKGLQDHASSLEQLVAERTEELQDLYEEVRKLSITDELTGVYNRRGLNYLGVREVNRARRFGNHLSAILFDLDHFKQINDRHGHRIGDQLLRMVAQQCRDEIREVDIIGRYGGEEFVVILPETPIEDALQTAERLRQSIERQSIFTDNGEISITISLGVSCIKDEMENLSTLIDKADKAMYLAKQAGRNCIRRSE